jgi:hypothetical protein
MRGCPGGSARTHWGSVEVGEEAITTLQASYTMEGTQTPTVSNNNKQKNMIKEIILL